jgi:serine/threonine protein kinase
LVPVYEAGEAEGRLFIAMRYVEGSDLKELLRDGPLTAERTVRLCAQVADALDFAHERGLVHRDVKPSNVLLDGRDHVYLADFGLTERLAEPRRVEPNLLGTIDYIAPEQIRGEEVDGRADIYSLGCVVCECLTGQPPFRRSTDAAILFAHLEEEPAARPGLKAVVAKALAKDPADRYRSCTELVDAARQTLRIGRPKPVTHAPAAPRGPTPATPRPTTRQSSDPTRQPGSCSTAGSPAAHAAWDPPGGPARRRRRPRADQESGTPSR